MYGNASKIQKSKNKIELRQHINFNINQLRENAHKLKIDIENPENKEILKKVNKK